MKTKEFQDKVLVLSDRIYPFVVRLLGNQENAKDAVQEIMIKLWDRRKQLAGHPNINGFVFLTARNHCLDILKKYRFGQGDPGFNLQLIDSETGQDKLEWKELNNLLKEVLQKLPEQQRTVVIMRDIDGCSFDEIAAVMQLKKEYIRVLLSRGRKQIMIELNKLYSYEQREIR